MEKGCVFCDLRIEVEAVLVERIETVPYTEHAHQTRQGQIRRFVYSFGLWRQFRYTLNTTKRQQSNDILFSGIWKLWHRPDIHAVVTVALVWKPKNFGTKHKQILSWIRDLIPSQVRCWGMGSAVTRRCVDGWVGPDVSKERNLFIFKGEETHWFFPSTSRPLRYMHYFPLERREAPTQWTCLPCFMNVFRRLLQYVNVSLCSRLLLVLWLSCYCCLSHTKENWKLQAEAQRSLTGTLCCAASTIMIQ